jgi:hypothetical protein
MKIKRVIEVLLKDELITENRYGFSINEKGRKQIKDNHVGY